MIAYNDGRPALAERTIRAGETAGHVLMMTTPFSDRVSRRDAWYWLPGSSQMGGWPFVILANQIASYLVGSGEQQLTTLPAPTPCRWRSATLRQRPRRSPWPNRATMLPRYLLLRPDGTIMPLSPMENGQLSISSVEQVGNYKVQSC